MQASGGLRGEIGEQHAHNETGMTGTLAIHNDALSLDLSLLHGHLHLNRHFCPRGKRVGALKLNPILVNTHSSGGNREPLTRGLDEEGPEERLVVGFAGAHRCKMLDTVTQDIVPSIDEAVRTSSRRN